MHIFDVVRISLYEATEESIVRIDLRDSFIICFAIVHNSLLVFNEVREVLRGELVSYVFSKVIHHTSVVSGSLYIWRRQPLIFLLPFVVIEITIFHNNSKVK